jgi:hypothetical protein
MSHDLPSQRVPPQRAGDPERARIVPKPEHPKTSGYNEPDQLRMGPPDAPNPDAAGREEAQVASQLPGEEDEEQDPTEDAPPGENKREPIKDPDPADTKLHVQQSSR